MMVHLENVGEECLRLGVSWMPCFSVEGCRQVLL